MNRNASVAAMAVVIVVVLLGSYMGAYYALLVGIDPWTAVLAEQPQPLYRWDNDVVAMVMKPAHHVDRLLRPEYWKPNSPFIKWEDSAP